MWGMLSVWILGAGSAVMAGTLERPLEVRVNGRDVLATRVTYEVVAGTAQTRRPLRLDVDQNVPIEIDRGQVRPVELQLRQPTVFTFPDNNSLELDGVITLHREGTIAFAAVHEGKIANWSGPGGERLVLNCGGRVNADLTRRPRLLQFHPNGQLASGCDNLVPARYPAVNGDLVELTSMAGALDFNSQGLLEYVQAGYMSTLRVLGQRVRLADRAEIHFHKNGLPHFFTLADGQSLEVKSAHGSMRVTNPPGRQASISLTEDQHLERGYLAEETRVGALRVGPGRVMLDPASNTISQVEIPPQSIRMGTRDFVIHDYVQMNASGRISAVVLRETVTLRFGRQDYTIEGLIALDDAGRMRMVQLARDSEGQLSGQRVALLRGDVLIFDEEGDLVGVKPGSTAPRPRLAPQVDA